MQQGPVVSCPSCGAVYSLPASGCPDCGAKPEMLPSGLGQLHDAGVAVMRPRPPAKRQRPWATIIALGGTALVALVASLASMRTREEVPALKVARPAQAPAAPSAEPSRALDADVALDQARGEATRWNADALLARIEAGPFAAGKLLPEGALKAEFGKPAGAHLGPGAGLHKEILVVTVSLGGVTTSTRDAPDGIGLADPNCIVQDVWRKVMPERIEGVLSLRYERSAKDDRAVFHVLKEGSPEPLHVLDGASCSFLLPR